MKNNNCFSEVIESSLSGWLAQSWQWNTFASYGSLVGIQTNTRHLLGVVYQVQTGSMDPTRYPFPYQKTEEELLKEQPQIFEFLKTTFSVSIVGYYENGRIFYTLAPEPAKIHAFVGYVNKELSQQFFADVRYMHLLFNAQIQSIDELLLAILRYQSTCGWLSEEKIGNFVKTFSLLTGNDYRRLKLFLQRLEHVVKSLDT